MTRPPAARRVLVVAPHPDDEVIGAWALIRAAIARGARVDLIVASDGAASHPGSATWPPARLVRERRRETLRAMRALAVPQARVRFLRLPDGMLGAGAATTRALSRALRRLPPPRLIVGPVADDAHGDHRAVAAAIARLPRRGEQRIGYRVWPLVPRARGAALGIGLTGRDLVAKRRAIAGYRTQGGRIADATAGCTLTWRHRRAFVRPSERYERIA